ncbi:MAG: ABC transporter substrate-binding protein [Nitrospira sp.]
MSTVRRTARGNLTLPVFFPLFLLWLTGLPNFADATDIAILKSSELPYYEQAVSGFKAGISPTTKVTEYNLGGQLARGREIGKSLRASPPDLIVAVGLKAAMAAKLEIFDTPVVFCLVLSPETHGLPTSNMTGIAVRTSPEVQLTMLRSVMPNRHRIGVLYDEELSGTFIRDAHRAAKQQGLELVAVAIHGQDDVPKSLRGLLPTIDALWLTQDQTVISESAIPFFLESTLDAKVPIFTFSSTLVQQGALGALIVDAWAVGQQAARIAQARLKEPAASTGTLQAPERPQLALNLHSAEYLGLTLPSEVVRLAGQLFGGPGAMAQKPASSDLIP